MRPRPHCGSGCDDGTDSGCGSDPTPPQPTSRHLRRGHQTRGHPGQGHPGRTASAGASRAECGHRCGADRRGPAPPPPGRGPAPPGWVRAVPRGCGLPRGGRPRGDRKMAVGHAPRRTGVRPRRLPTSARRPPPRRRSPPRASDRDPRPRLRPRSRRRRPPTWQRRSRRHPRTDCGCGSGHPETLAGDVLHPTGHLVHHQRALHSPTLRCRPATPGWRAWGPWTVRVRAGQRRQAVSGRRGGPGHLGPLHRGLPSLRSLLMAHALRRAQGGSPVGVVPAWRPPPRSTGADAPPGGRRPPGHTTR